MFVLPVSDSSIDEEYVRSPNRFGQPFLARGIAGVGGDAENRIAKLPAHRLERFIGSYSDRHARAFGGENAQCLEPNPARAASDECPLPFAVWPSFGLHAVGLNYSQ